MIIRKAQARDLEACLGLDEAFETDYVWQMESTRMNGSISVAFRTTRLPRAMRVPATLPRDVIAEHYEKGECFLIADDRGRVCGYVDATEDPWERVGWVHRLTVAPDLRRHGVGTQLLQACLDWAREQHLRAVMVEAATKNFPASALFQKQGFVFCGYNDGYHANRDIALYFALSLR